MGVERRGMLRGIRGICYEVVELQGVDGVKRIRYLVYSVVAFCFVLTDIA